MRNNNLLPAVILDNIMANMPGHVYWKDMHGVYLGCNDQQAKTLGLQYGHEVIGKTDFDLPWPKQSAKQFQSNDQRIMRNGVAETIEEIIDAQGSIVFSIKSPIKDAHNKVHGILGISIDITEKKRSEQLEKEQEIAKKNAALMNILSSSVAHEIRTPLSIIKINADLVNMLNIPEHIHNNKIHQQFTERMDNIQQAIKECAQVMDMLLVKLKKMAMADTQDKNLETCSMMQTIQTALFEYPFRTHEQALVHYTPPAENFMYKGHERLTKHILFNLLRNALHVIQANQKGEIFIECHADKTHYQLTFKDTAQGVPADYIPKMFNAFETTDDAHSGTGLGLAFCKLVMESYGGRIECTSHEGEFTKFTLYFPLT